MMAADDHSLARPAPVHVRRRLVIVESGATTFASALQQESDETVVMAQLADELPSQFAERVLHRVVTSELSRRYFDAAILFTGGPAADHSTACSARRCIALGVAAHAEASRDLEELVVVAPADSTPELRERLLELADDLMLASGDEPLRVRVCFQSDGCLQDPVLAVAKTRISPKPVDPLPEVARTRPESTILARQR
jgi:hypothetical protein